MNLDRRAVNFCNMKINGVRGVIFMVRLVLSLPVLIALAAGLFGCKSYTDYRHQADEVAAKIIEQKQQDALGRSEKFSIERPSDILRRRLLIEQNLPYSGPASLGTDKLKPIPHWPEKDYPGPEAAFDALDLLEPDKPLRLSLVDALQVGARNNFEYQSLKEEIFRAALDLDLERNEFRTIFAGQVESLLKADKTGDKTVSGAENSGSLDIGKKLESGVSLTTALAVDLANLFTLGGASSLGIAGDATITVPLLRGSGRHIVREPLTQAERNVVYAIYDFERFKQTFVVEVARRYLDVLKQLDQVKNAEENYRSLMASARRSRRLADAGRLPEIQVDQAMQNELRARNRWISAKEAYKSALDSFKSFLGLPPDAKVELDRSELEHIVESALKLVDEVDEDVESQAMGNIAAAEMPVELAEPGREKAARFEIDEEVAIRAALENRLDLKTAQGRVYDAQRAVVVAADALGAGLTFFAKASAGSRRGISSATSDDAYLHLDKGVYSGLLKLDLPLERTAERNAYRNSFILLERAVRAVQSLEDKIKLEVRNRLRDLLESRESLKIQAKSVALARKRVRSSNLFLEAGRAEMRDLLEAQDALLAAQNALTAAAVNYRVAELQLQADMGVLKVDEKGLWQEETSFLEELYSVGK